MKPILFNTDMVRALSDRRKTVTRRAIKPQPIQWICYHGATDKWFYCNGTEVGEECKPPYRPGDILYVRETWMVESGRYYYRADFESDYLSPCETLSGGYPESCRSYPGCEGCMKEPQRIIWRPSIHMPKEASRIFLRVTNVRVERLQDMTEDDVFTEGAEKLCECSEEHTIYYPEGGMDACFNTNCCSAELCSAFKSYQELFGERIWNRTIKPSELSRYGWDANPWVWVIEFEVVERDEALAWDKLSEMTFEDKIELYDKWNDGGRCFIGS